jgi:CPA2 family monovalent cation:H+ antiporter-2
MGHSGRRYRGESGAVKQLREQHRPVVFGNATNPFVLDAAGIRRAHGVVVALPDALDARRVLNEVRSKRPDVDIILRAHSETEQAYLMDHGATEVVVAKAELALEIVHHTLHRAGADDAAIDAMLFTVRHARMPDDSDRWTGS